MKITNIKESGANNLMMWAVSNGATIKEDQQLQSLINDELFFLVTLSDVNFLELFRLTQMYREKLRILSEEKADVPLRKELILLFNGTYCPDNNDQETKAPMYECVETVVQSFINLVMQMGTDDDIIQSSALRLFLPMISRKFEIQIPITFIDLVESISDEEAARIFISEYPNTLHDIFDTENHGFMTMLQLAFLKATAIVKYNPRYEQYLRLTRYSPIKTCNNSNLYKFGLLGFHKYDEVVRTEVRCSLFNPDKDILGNVLKRLSKINTPLHISFAVQLPIQYMQMLENSFGRDVLDITYESSMVNIIDGGIVYDDFITQDIVEDDEESTARVEDHNNAINAYRVRIAEANQLLLNAIPLLLNNDEDNDVDVTAVFAMLPAIYSTKAVITLNLEHSAKYLAHYDVIIAEMFKEMLDLASSVIEDINRAK